MQWIDWILVVIPLAMVFGFAIYTNRYVKSVADFLSGGRCAGRFLLANAHGESESGLANSMSRFEIVLVSGFVLSYWERLYYPVALLVAISGFVIYRFRETRALTLAQFLEARYSRRFRLFMGMLAFVSGILNYGIFPAISARFFIYFLDLPLAVHLGGVGVSTFSLIMFVYLSCTALIVMLGGQATMMITCCLEGLLSQLIYVVIAVAVLLVVSWHQIVAVMADAGPGQSLINPFDTGRVQDYNLWFILMGIYIRIYTTMAMQHKQGFNSAALTPHESRMGGVLGEWRSYARTLMVLVVGLCAMTYLRSPAFAVQAAPVKLAISGVPDAYLQQQMTIPIVLRFLLPVGVKGLFCSLMVMGLLSGDGGHLHSWGSIFIQDVVLPLRKKALTPRQHILALRLAITAVAAFAFVFSTYFTQTEYIMLWWLLTGAVFTGGAGAAIIGGLYWRKGTTSAAWAGAITGSALSFIGIVLGSFWPAVRGWFAPGLLRLDIYLPEKFWFNYQVSGFIAAVTAALVYIFTSLLTCRRDFDLDRMLHRGVHSAGVQKPPALPWRERLKIRNILRFDSEFTRGDKLVSGGIFWWSMGLALINVVVTIWNLVFYRWPVRWWADYWLVLAIVVPFVISVGTVVWFTIEGLGDMRSFFTALKNLKRDTRDDGRVVGHHNSGGRTNPRTGEGVKARMPARVEEFLKRFARPDPAFSPAPLWWWSGGKLEIGRLLWQLDQLKAMGVHNVVVINLAPSGTLFGCDADDPPFLSEAWWTIFERVCDRAAEIGTSVWFYDQIGFSGASFQAELAASHPDCIARQLRSASSEGTGTLRAQCPASATGLAAYVFPLSRPGEVKYVSVADGCAEARVEEPSRLRLVYVLKLGYDFFSPAACRRLLETVHGEFERRLPRHVGKTIVGSFQDELADLPTWGETFDETFAARHGQRLSEVVHHLFEEGGAEARRTRLRYHSHRAELAEEAFFKPFFQWHQERGLQCGFDAQSPAREARVLGSVVKYADYVQTHRWYAIPGSDLHGNGKLHASMAFMYDRRRVWIEGFHSTGWGGTLADTFDWLLPYLRAGANFYNPHAVYYATAKGWWEWAPPSTCWRQPYARHYRPFADTIARLTAILSEGVQQASVGVLFPSATVQANAGAVDHFPAASAADRALHETIGSMRWHQARLGPLDKMGLDFHLLDEATIQSAGLVGGAMVHREVAFGAVILPHVTILHDATLDRLIEFADAGGRVVAVGAGTIQTAAGRTVEVSSIPGAVVVESADLLGEVLGDTPRPIRCGVPTLFRRVGDVHVLLVPAVADMATEVKWDHWFAPMEHTTIVPERYLPAVDLLLPAHAGDIRRFDPRDGTVQAVAAAGRDADGVRVKLEFGGSPLAVLAWSESDSVSELPVSAPVGQTVVLADAWRCQYVPTLPEEYADTHDPEQEQLRWPHTTEFQWRRGTEAARTVRATFGVRAWRRDGEGGDLQPIGYSPRFGILQDRLHILTLGPKGHVPEEFVNLEKLAAGQCVTIITGVTCEDSGEAILAIGANAAKAACVNGQSAQADGAEHLWLTPVKLRGGENSIELRLTARREGAVRLFWCLLKRDGAGAFARPERIAPLAAAGPGSLLVYRKRFHPGAPVNHWKMKVSIAAMASVFLDGKPLGRQGGFDPYRPMMRGQTYEVDRLPAGDHELRVDVVQPERNAPLVVDGAGVVSDATWTLGDGEPVQVHDRQEADGAAWLLYRRPHPLPQTAWLSGGAGESPVLDLPLVPPCAQAESQSLEWIIPPGAIAMQVDLAAHVQARLVVDGIECRIEQDGQVALPAGGAARLAILNVSSRQLGGGLLNGPVVYRFEAGIIKTGSWVQQGLRSYSGALRMGQTLEIPANYRGGAVILDLGRVRGTVEVMVNGRPAGVRWMSPYQVDVAGFIRPGVNQLELLVTNTLANHLSTWSPTTWWSPDQLEAGVFGPVTVFITLS